MVGLPELSFNRNEPDTAEYTRYLYDSLRHISNVFLPARTDLFRKFSRAKVVFFLWGTLGLRHSVTKGTCKQEEEAKQLLASGTLPFPGGWPVETTTEGAVLKFGVPRLPIMFKFVDLAESDCATGMDTWLSNIGGAYMPAIQAAIVTSFVTQASVFYTSEDVVCDAGKCFLHK